MDGWNLGEEVSSTSSLFRNMKGEGRKEGKEKRKKKGKRLWETRRWALAWSREVGAPVRKT